MSKQKAFILLLILLTCQSTKASQLHPHTGEIPYAALSFETSLTLINFSESEEQKIFQAAQLIKRVIATKEFRESVLNHTWDGKQQFVNNKGLTNLEIYNLLLEASEAYNPVKNNVLDAELELYFEANKTIGYTFPTSRRIWMNKKYFDKYTPIQVADNLVHEWMHKLGFEHSSTWSKERDHSVPYAIGYIVEEIARKIARP
jgi:hypothetical protein